MAYPTYVSYKSDYDSSSTTTHTITWPSGVTNGNLLYGMFTCKQVGGENLVISSHSSNIYHSFNNYDLGDGSGYVHAMTFWGIAAATNTFVITSVGSVVGRWIVYEFADHNIEYGSSSGFYGLVGEWYWNAAGTHFDMPICPVPAYYGAHDYTWLAFVCYDSIGSFTCPTLFGNQINNLAASSSEASVAVARYDYNTEQLDPGNWNTGVASNMIYFAHTVRIPPGIYPEDTPSGFGFIVPSSNVDLP